jgi:hypothetical protein
MSSAPDYGFSGNGPRLASANGNIGLGGGFSGSISKPNAPAYPSLDARP